MEPESSFSNLQDPHFLLSWARSIQSILPFSFLKIHLILCLHLRPALPSSFFPSDLSTETL